MTREEAIEVLEELWKYEHSGFSEKDIREALDMAINALKNEPTDGDLISRFRDYQIEWLTSHNDIDLQETEMWVVQFLKDTAECFLKTELPSAEKTTLHNFEQPQTTDTDLISREIEKADFLMAKVRDFERTAIRVKHNTENIDRLIDYIHGVIVNTENNHFVFSARRKYVLQEKFKLPSAEKTENGDSIKIKERFAREIEYANKDIDFAEGTDESEENYMRGYLGGILCAYRIVFGKSYEESEEEE